MTTATTKEYQIWYDASPHDSWIQGGYTNWTSDRREAEGRYDFWKEAGHTVVFYEREVGQAIKVER